MPLSAAKCTKLEIQLPFYERNVFAILKSKKWYRIRAACVMSRERVFALIEEHTGWLFGRCTEHHV